MTIMPDKLYNLSQLTELAGGMDDFVQTMIDTFLEHTPSQFNSMEEAYNQKDFKTMGDLAHKIKPSIDLFQIEGLGDLIRSVERQGKANEALPNLGEQIKKIRNVLFEAMDQLKNR